MTVRPDEMNAALIAAHEEIARLRSAHDAEVGALRESLEAAQIKATRLHDARCLSLEIAEHAERDARRYRWLRDGEGDHGSPYVCGVHGAPMADAGWLTGDDLDAAIDRAMEGEDGNA